MNGGEEPVRQVGLRVVLCPGMKRSASTWSCSVRRELLGCEAREQGAGFAFDYRHHTDGVISAAIGQLNA